MSREHAEMESVYERFDPNDSCERLLPLNRIKSRITLNKVIAFEYGALTEDHFDTKDFTTVASGNKLILANRNLRMALPVYLYSPSEHIHEHAIVKATDILDTRIAVCNDGTFLPVVSPDIYREETLKKTIVVEDFDLWDKGQLTYRGQRLKVDDALRHELWETGFVACPIMEHPNKSKVKVVLRPREEILIKDPGKLLVSGKIEVNGAEFPVEITRRQRGNLLRRRSLLTMVNERPVLLRFPRQGADNTSHTQTSVHFSYVAELKIEDDAEYCKTLRQFLNDPRAEETRVYTEDVPNWITSLPDGRYGDYLTQLLEDPRSADCLASLLAEHVPPADLPSYELAILTTFEQTWELLGYSKGSLVSSINLAPLEEMTIEVFTWEKYKVEEEKTFGTEYEFNQEVNTMAKADTTISRDLKESMDGSLSANGDISVPTEYFTLGADVGGEVSQAVEEGLNSDVNLITDGTIKSAEKFKTNHQVKIVQTHETGEENRAIRKLRNSNSNLTLTFNYFEILENYRVTTEVKDASKYCILVDTPQINAFDLDFIMAYEYRLQQLLLSPNYKRGFDAARILVAQKWFDEQSAIQEELNSPMISPGSTSSTAPGQDMVEASPVTGIFATAKQIYDVLEKFLNELDAENAMLHLAEHHNPLNSGGVSYNALQNSRTTMKRYSFWIKLNNIYPSFQDKAKQYLDTLDNAFGKHEREPDVIRELSFLIADIDQFYAVKMVAASTVVQAIMKLPLLVAGPFSPFVIGLLEPIIFDLAYNHDDIGLSQLIDKAQRNIKPIEDTQNAVITHKQVDIPTVEVQPAPPPRKIVPQVYGHQELAEAHADFDKLQVHLEKHKTYYANGIWQAEDENERFNRLRMQGLAGYVENRLMGFVGKKAIYPLKRHSLPKTVLDALESFKPKPDNLQEQKVEEVSLPTTGVHMDTMLGTCDALEPYLLDRRDIDKDVRLAQADIVKEQALQAKEETRRMKAQVDAIVADSPGIDTAIDSATN